MAYNKIECVGSILSKYPEAVAQTLILPGKQIRMISYELFQVGLLVVFFDILFKYIIYKIVIRVTWLKCFPSRRKT